MSRIIFKSLAFLSAFVLVLMLHKSAAAFGGSGDLDCKNGREAVGDLGITSMSMKGSMTYKPEKGSMTYKPETGERSWYFQAEPKIQGIDPEGPAAGKLKKGDRIVAIDGVPITTHKAGQRFANIVPDESVNLTVRRGRRLVETTVVARAVCPEDHPLWPDTDIANINFDLDGLSEAIESISRIAGTDIEIPELPELPELPGLPRLPKLSEFPTPRAWFGMSISCNGCTIKASKNREPAQWLFHNPPEVHAVEPGSPADVAGIEAGDILTHIDGVRLDSKEGGKRFTSIDPGETVTWTIRRDGKEQTISVEAREHPRAVREEDSKTLGRSRLVHEGGESLEGAPVLFSGTVGGAEVEVRGKSSVRVEEDSSTGEILVRTRDAVVRIRVPKEKN